ncbi:MAG: hypothetical protein NTV34_20855, partial [Proteobacteria bacterium]|nr:hypothetical protein [Pseudomonadota bacterium]
YGYESWIRLKSTSGFIIEYNPEVSTYQKLVGIINPRYRGVAPDKLTTPSILDVTEYLLHEIGHKYELDEHDAWEFAQTLIKYFSFIKAILPLECNVSMTVRNVSPEFYLNQTVTLDSVHPAYLFKVGDIGYRLELLENLYETVWTIEFDTVEPLFNNTVVHSIIHQMSARAGTPFAGKIMLGYGHLADVSCK